jgi:hypothetical protein
MHITISPQTATTSDLAARLTDVGLEALAGESTPVDSVAMELRLWHALEAELEHERNWKVVVPRRGQVGPLGQLLQQVVSRAARRITREQHANKNLCPA